MHPNGAPGCGTGSPTGGAVRCTAPAQWTECSSCGNAPPTTSLANAFAALMVCGGVSVGHRRPGVGVADAVTWSLMLTGGAHPLPARVTEGVLSRCWMHRSLTVCRGMAGAGFQAGVQASAGWPVAAIRWRQGRKRGEMPLNVDRNLCATPTERKLFMVRSRCRVGWADAGADLLAAALGPHRALAVSAVLYLGCALAIRVRLPRLQPGEFGGTPGSARGDGGAVRASLHGAGLLLRGRTVRRLMLAQWLPPAFVAGAEGLIVAYAGGRHFAPGWYAVLMGCLPVGMLAGDLLVGRLLLPPGSDWWSR